MADILQITSSYAFYLMKMYELRLECHLICFKGYNYKHLSFALADNDLAPTTWLDIIWTNDGYFINACMHYLASMS